MKGFALVFIIILALVAPAAASADSIVYVKDGNVWLTSPDGSKQYQVTFDGGYSSPSQSTNGTIGAIRNKMLVRLDRSGHQISSIPAIGTDLNPKFYGPYEARLSPDASKFAYWFGSYGSYTSGDIEYGHFESQSTWTYADHFTDPATESEYYLGITQPEWLSNDRLLTGYDFWMTLWTWKLGTGHGYTNNSAQYAAQFKDSQGYNYYFGDPALSPDGTRLALTDGGDATMNTRLFLAQVPGPIFVGEPPYDNDYLGSTPVDQPVLSCFHNFSGAIWNPSWGSDSVHLAYSLPDGVHVMNTTGYGNPDPQTGDCPADQLIAPGGAEPAYGPKDVDMAQKPSPPVTPQTGPSTTPTTPTTPTPPPPTQPQAKPFTFVASLSPASFRAAKSTTIKYASSAAAKLKITVKTAGGKAVKGVIKATAKPGANKLRFPGRLGGKKLKPGRYKLTIVASPANATAQTVTLAFRITR